MARHNYDAYSTGELLALLENRGIQTSFREALIIRLKLDDDRIHNSSTEREGLYRQLALRQFQQMVIDKSNEDWLCELKQALNESPVKGSVEVTKEQSVETSASAKFRPDLGEGDSDSDDSISLPSLPERPSCIPRRHTTGLPTERAPSPSSDVSDSSDSDSDGSINEAVALELSSSDNNQQHVLSDISNQEPTVLESSSNDNNPPHLLSDISNHKPAGSESSPNDNNRPYILSPPENSSNHEPTVLESSSNINNQPFILSPLENQPNSNCAHRLLIKMKDKVKHIFTPCRRRTASSSSSHPYPSKHKRNKLSSPVSTLIRRPPPEPAAATTPAPTPPSPPPTPTPPTNPPPS